MLASESRTTLANQAAPNPHGAYVLYWMIAARRSSWSFALDRALAHAKQLHRPLLVVEALRADYPWASDRFHAFVLQGMADNARAFAAAGITYLPYVEPAPGEGKGLIDTLARDACIVITDEQPGFFLPRMVASVAARVAVRVELVDGNGMFPLRAFERAYPTAAPFRRALQKLAHPHLLAHPEPHPLAKLPRSVRDADLPRGVVSRWPAAASKLLTDPHALAALPIDHSVPPAPYRGGSRAASAQLDGFIRDRLPRYDQRNHPDADAASGLSPYLHFGHISTHEITACIWEAADWNPSRLADKPTGTRDGWWGLPATSEAFLDELITWRELGYGFCFHRADHASYSALPAWARATLEKHARDPRSELYTRGDLEAARTADPIWNAAQRELVATGRMHNYLRMLWGKNVLAWSKTPSAALATLIHLNNKYAVDGRDPNSYSGILWCLGLFDRPWGPQRPIFGLVRYMSSSATARKLRLRGYLERWSEVPTCRLPHRSYG